MALGYVDPRAGPLPSAGLATAACVGGVTNLRTES